MSCFALPLHQSLPANECRERPGPQNIERCAAGGLGPASCSPRCFEASSTTAVQARTSRHHSTLPRCSSASFRPLPAFSGLLPPCASFASAGWDPCSCTACCFLVSCSAAQGNVVAPSELTPLVTLSGAVHVDASVLCGCPYPSSCSNTAACARAVTGSGAGPQSLCQLHAALQRES